MLDEKAYDEAMKQLAAEPAHHLPRVSRNCAATFLRRRARSAEARTAYDLALTKFDALARDDENRQRGGYKEMVQTKRDSLGAAK
jgi:predicted negative regulator of RcsB-dependent stress response